MAINGSFPKHDFNGNFVRMDANGDFMTNSPTEQEPTDKSLNKIRLV